MHVVFFSSEVVPFAKTGGMADVCGALPLALEKAGAKVTIVMPLYSCIDQGKYQLYKPHPSYATTTIGSDIRVIFIEHHAFFNREGLYNDWRGDYRDNLQRFQFFCKRGLEILKETHKKIDLIHCHDWQTGMIPPYLKYLFKRDKLFAKCLTVFTVHNIAYQGVFPKEQFHFLGLDGNLFNADGFEFYGKINLLKAGILLSDQVTTVSPRYSQEIQSGEFGWGLDGVMRARRENLSGILNGIDYEVWDPQHDSWLAAPYSATDLSGKAANKADLQRSCHFAVNGRVPLLSFVGRLSKQKGVDVLIPALEGILRHNDVQVVFLGVGEDRYHRMLQHLAGNFGGKVSVHLKFDEGLAHKIYAGSDIFLMPSQYEPCGLSQMISLRYGTIPLVFHTGGLADTVMPFDQQGNGFVFYHYNSGAVYETIRRAIEVFHNEPLFRSLIEKAFEYNFSWDIAAQHYLHLYEQLRKKKT
jgi:starch synthase